MARPKGQPKLGGRKKGVPNKVTATWRQEIAASGLTPLEYMLSMLRDEEQKPEMRFEAAKAAAPYLHPKLATIEHSGKDGGPIEHAHTIDAFTSRISRMSARTPEDGGD